MEPFTVVDVTSWAVISSEPLGRNEKVWVRAPVGRDDRRDDWLFKPVVVPPSTGCRQGEDWAEKIVTELAALIGVPCAPVELAARSLAEGSISRNIVPPGCDRILGAELLASRNGEYRARIRGSGGRERAVPGRPGHSPESILEALRGCRTPPDACVTDAPALFAAYLVLDAWVANQDRHDQNWAVLRPREGDEVLTLAPSYDHASSLGFSFTDEGRRGQLANGIAAFARRGRAHRFEHDPDGPRSAIPSLVAVAHRAVRLAGQAAPLDRLERLAGTDVEDVVRRVPRLSDVTARFVLELLDTNRGRLLDER